MTDLSPTGFAISVIGGLGVPLTPDNVNALESWEKEEGGHWNNSRKYNPLNTTLGCGSTAAGITVADCGGSQGNIAGYASWDDGVKATVDTLKEPRYQSIIDAMQSGTNGPGVIAAVNASPWTTHGAIYDVFVKTPHDIAKVLTDEAISTSPGLVDSVKKVAKEVAKPLEWTAEFAKLLGHLMDVSFWIRAGEFAGGAVAIFVGLWLVFRQELPSPSSIGKMLPI